MMLRIIEYFAKLQSLKITQNSRSFELAVHHSIDRTRLPIGVPQ